MAEIKSENLASPSLSAMKKRALPARSIDNPLIKLRESFGTDDYNFQCLRGLSLKEINNPKSNGSKHLKIFRDLCKLTKSSMTALNASCPGLPPDSIMKTLELVTHPRSKVVVLRGILPGQRNTDPQILGYGIVMLGRENIIDAYHIPEKLLEKEDACRVIRLFATNEAREFLPRGEAFSNIIDRIKYLSGDGLLIGMVLTDIQSTTGEKLNPSVWLDAMHALDARGFEETGFGLTEEINSLRIPFEWWTWSKASKGTEAQDKLATKIAELDYYKQERLAPLVPAIPIRYATMVAHGRWVHGYDLARAYPGNLVIAPTYQQTQRPEGAHNLVRIKPEALGTYIEAGKLDSSVVMGALPDIINLNPNLAPKEAIKEFIEAQHLQLAIGGSLVLRYSVAPEKDHLIQLRLAPKESELWNSFIHAREERHITDNSWDSVKEMSSPDQSKQAWLTPLSVAMEFMNKFTHMGEEKGRHLYAVLKAKECLGMIEGSGFRINYHASAPSARYEKRAFKNKIELYNLSGEKLDYPALMQVTIAEKVTESDAVQIKVSWDRPIDNPRFAKVKRFEKIGSDGEILAIQELVTRQRKDSTKLVACDVLPFYLHKVSGKIELIFGAREAPRAITILSSNNSASSGFSSPYLIEQIGALLDSRKIENSEAISDSTTTILENRANIGAEEIVKFLKPTIGYTRPDSYDELVLMQAVETNKAYWEGVVEVNVDNLHTQPRMLTFEASRYLQSCQAGISPDRRVELMVYQTGIASKANLGPWLGEPLPLRDQADLIFGSKNPSFPEIAKKQISYVESTIPAQPQFFQTREAHFVEVDKQNNKIGSTDLEYIQTYEEQKLSDHSVSVLPISKEKREIFVGINQEDFIAPYLHEGIASLFSLPTFRIPDNIESSAESYRWTIRRLGKFFGISTNQLQKLGGKYLASPGISPETIQPMICEVSHKESLENGLQWVSLKQLLANADKIKCLQLRTAVYRAGHMYGLLGADE